MVEFGAKYTVTFTSDTGSTISVLLDAPSPIITGGYGGWEIVDRPKRIGITRFNTRNPISEDIAIIFDGGVDEISQETDIGRLETMAIGEPPPRVKVSGTALYTDKTWIITSIDWDNVNTVWNSDGDTVFRTRQSAVVHLLEFVDDSVIVTLPSPAVVNRPPGKTVKLQSGLTLKQIAQKVFNDPDRYMEIFFANPWIDPDPRAIVPAGTVLTIPGQANFTVPVSAVQAGAQ